MIPYADTNFNLICGMQMAKIAKDRNHQSGWLVGMASHRPPTGSLNAKPERTTLEHLLVAAFRESAADLFVQNAALSRVAAAE